MLTSHWYLYGGVPPAAPVSHTNPCSSWSMTDVFVTGVAIDGFGGIVVVLTVEVVVFIVDTVVTLIVVVGMLVDVVTEVVVGTDVVVSAVVVVTGIDVVVLVVQFWLDGQMDDVGIDVVD